MTLIQLQEVLGSSIEKIRSTDPESSDHLSAVRDAESIARLAKQMINNADVILRTDKLCSSTSRIDQIVGR